MALPDGFIEANEIVLFEILGIPFLAAGEGYVVSDNFGTIRTATSINPSAVIRTEVERILASMTAATVTRLLVYITRWEAIGTQVIRQEAGSVGDVSGVTLDYRDERALIKDRVQNMVPVYKLWEFHQKQQASGPGISREVLR